MSRFQVIRHQRHLECALVAGARDAGELSYGEDLLEQIRALDDDLARLCAASESGGDRRGAVAACRERLRALEVCAKVRGAIQTGSRSLTVVNVHEGNDREDLSEYLCALGCPQDLVNTVLGYVEKPKMMVEGEMVNAS